MSAALDFRGGSADCSDFVARHADGETPSSYGKIPLRTKGEALVDRVMDAAGDVFDGYAYALVGGIIWVPMLDTSEPGFALTVTEGAEILADFAVVASARALVAP